MIVIVTVAILLCGELYALRSEIFEKFCVGMLFKFQWHTEKFWAESGFGQGFDSTSLLKMNCKWNKPLVK